MCEFVEGELLVSHHQDDTAASRLIEAIQSERDERFTHIRVLQSLEQKLRQTEAPLRDGLVSRFVRLGVPEGQEVFKASMLQHHYKLATIESFVSREYRSIPDFFLDSRHHFHVVPNGILSPSFQFSTPWHNYDYQKLFGWPGPSSTTRTIAILDTGILNLNGFNVVSYRNFTESSTAFDVTDRHVLEHGTSLAEIIRDLCPQAELIIHKVVGDGGYATEWDTLAALATRTGADVINLSLAFGLNTIQCSSCGYQSRTSRSAVFENILDQAAGQDAIIVAAAGNAGAAALAFPARFGRVVAIESINGSGTLSQFSNRGALDEDGNPHPRVFVLPGGEDQAGGTKPTEWIGTTAAGLPVAGTSQATAYASAIIAHVWGQPAHAAKSADDVVDLLVRGADRTMSAYTQADYGNGLMRP